MKISNALNALVTVGLVFLAMACNSELHDEINIDTERQEILDYLESLDYVIDSVTFKDDMVFYETDMGWEREHLLKRSRGEFEMMPVDNPEPLDLTMAVDRQRALLESNMAGALTRQNAANISYFIRAHVAIFLGPGWTSAINNAADEWNELSNCRITYNRVFSENEADIIITTDNDNDPNIPTGLQDIPIGAVAATAMPSNGQAFGFIVINDFWYWYTKQKTAIMHEMGHAVGFMHTGTNEGQQVFGTPVNQSNSVMNTTLAQSSSTLRSGDIRMARLYYPNSLPRPTCASVFRQSAGRLRVTYHNPDLINTPYYWVRITKYNLKGALLDDLYVRSTPSNNTGEDTILWDGHGSGQYLFAVRAFNFKRDVWSSRTNQMLVTL